ncbi:MAG: hypothetical protein M1824_006504 [Vezdaea acicularis]|nr:MAG: hypothetical protein M1824_006504 [Vezdaea acicularis]
MQILILPLLVLPLILQRFPPASAQFNDLNHALRHPQFPGWQQYEFNSNRLRLPRLPRLPRFRIPSIPGRRRTNTRPNAENPRNHPEMDYHDESCLSKATAIQRIYDDRAPSYDTSPWHKIQALDYLRWATLVPRMNVLDLACGTGLFTILAKQAVGCCGTVIGVDFSAAMLQVARNKASLQMLDIEFIEHDILDMSDLNFPVKFDVITCASAFSFVDDPAATLRHWATFLKPGGKIIFDVPTEESQLAGRVAAQAAKNLEIPIIWNNLWVDRQDSLVWVMQRAGLEPWAFRSQVYQSSRITFDKGVEIMSNTLLGPFLRCANDRRLYQEAMKLYEQEFARRTGKRSTLKDDVQFYVGIGTKPL